MACAAISHAYNMTDADLELTRTHHVPTVLLESGGEGSVHLPSSIDHGTHASAGAQGSQRNGSVRRDAPPLALVDKGFGAWSFVRCLPYIYK